MTDEKRWVVVRTRPNQINRACDSLRRQAVDFFVPFLPPDRFCKRKRLLFSPYFFARIGSYWTFLMSSHGVRDILRDQNGPRTISDKIVNTIMGQMDQNGFVILPEHTPSGFQPGQRLRAVRGAFEQHVGIYIGDATHQRVRVLFTLLNRAVRVECNREDLELAA